MGSFGAVFGVWDIWGIHESEIISKAYTTKAKDLWFCLERTPLKRALKFSGLGRGWSSLFSIGDGGGGGN